MEFFKKPETVPKRLKMLIFGSSGIGKTVFSLNFPNPAVVDTERGTDFYGEKFSFIRMQTSDHRVVYEAVNQLLSEPGDTKTFVIDPYTKLDDSIVLGHLVRLRIKNNNPNYTLQPQDYKTIKEDRKIFINKLLALDMNVIVTAPEKKEYSTAQGDFMQVIGSIADVPKEVPYMFDVILEAYKDTTGERMFKVHKDRSGLLPTIFPMNYNKLTELIGIDGLDRRAEVFTQDKNVSDLSGRRHETVIGDKKIFTAGITGEQLQLIQVKIVDMDSSVIKQKLLDEYAVDSFLDLRTDEAALFLNTLTNSKND